MPAMLTHLLPLAVGLSALIGPDGADIETAHLRWVITPQAGGAVEELRLLATGGDVAGADGLLQEGFGVGNFYVPNRRLNERLEVLEDRVDQPVLRYSYDCDGPNIQGLHVTRIMEPEVNAASMKVTWRIENRGDEAQWTTPWVRNDTAPGGSVDPADRVDLPTERGILSPDRSGYYLAARNWAAVTDPVAKETVYAVFHADHLHSFLAIVENQELSRGFQAVFTPFLLQPGETWETVYRVNVVRGLTRVHFASDELVAQIDYDGANLPVYIASAEPVRDLQIRARVRARNGRTWRLDDRAFSLDPGALVRFPFTWTAPAEDAYEFLAQITRNGAPFELGADTASPHGGIDAQFIVGEAPSSGFAPWTDAPFRLQRGRRELPRALAVRGDTAVWFESSLEKLHPQDVPVPTGTLDPVVRIAMARNERESFQLAVRPPEGKSLLDCRIVVGDLECEGGGGTIPASDVAVYRVGWCPVRIPSHFEGPTGLFPDPLLPVRAFTLTGGATQPFWFTVCARNTTPPGVYRGRIELRSPDLEPVVLTVQATVHPFELPVTPALKTDFGYWPRTALAQAQRLGGRADQTALDRAYLENALEHRVTLRDLAQLPPESPNYADALEGFARRLPELRARGATTFAVSPSLLEFPDHLQQANAFVVRHDLRKRAFCPIGDMPPRPAWPRLFERMQAWKDVAPDIPMMATTYGLSPFLPEALDIWAVHLPMLDTVNNRPILERASQGGEVWFFVNHEPARPYGNLLVDFRAIEHRILPWQAWALGMKGFHYRAINAIEKDRDPYDGLDDITPVNGDGFLVYPGADGPVNSIRWEILRDGIDDYDYLVIFQDRLRKLEARGGARHNALIERARSTGNLGGIVPDLVTFPRDPDALLAKRAEIAQVIALMDRALAQ